MNNLVTNVLQPLPESEVPLMELFGSQSPVIQRTATFTQKSPVQSRLNFILLSDDENSSGGENDISLDQTLPSMQVPVVTEVVKSSDVDQQQNSVLGEILGSKPNKFIYPKKLHLSESATSSLRVDSDQKLSTSNEYSLSIQTPSPTAVASDYSLTDGKSAFNATAAGSVDQQQYESLSELRKLFAPVSASPSFNPPVTRPISSVGQFGGFSTGSKKPITVSSAAVARAQQMLAPIDEEMSFSATIDPPLSFSKNSGPIENEMNLNISSSHTTGFGGFSTGTGHKISVSKSAIEKAKKLLIEDVNNEITPLDDLFSIQPAGSGVPTMMGFSTGNGKSLTSVSAAALGRAQQLMASVSDELSKDMPLTTSHSVGSGKSSRFKPVVPTKSPPMPAEKRLSDVDGFTCTPLGGFATAGGRKVSPSASAVNRAKEMFRAVESPEDLSDSEQPVEQIVPKTKNIGTNRLVASDCAVVPTVSHLPEFKRLSTGDSDTPMQKRKAECQIEEDSKRLKSTETPGNVQTVPLVYFIVLRVYPVQVGINFNQIDFTVPF